MKKKQAALLATIWVLATLFYFYEYMLRVAPSVMTQALMQSFAINAATVGVISGTYFYVYAPMQLAVGIAFDRFNACRLIAGAALIAALGTVGFGLSTHVFEAKMARAVIGFGSAFAFVGVLYLSSHWFSRNKRALLIGLANSVAMVGAVSGEGPLSLVENVFGWRKSLVGLGLVGLLISLALFWISSKQRSDSHIQEVKSKTLKEAWTNLLRVVKEWQTWLNAFAASAFFATTVGLGGLWGVPFLVQTHKLSLSAAGFANSMIYVGWLVGSPIIGGISDKAHRRRSMLLLCTFLSLLFVSAFIYIPLNSFLWASLFLFLTGFFSSAQLLHYSFIVDQHNAKATGSCIAFTNFLVASAGIVLQPLVGFVLQYLWQGGTENAIPYYSSSSFRLAMTFFPLSFALAFCLTFFLKEKKPAY